MSLNFTGSTPLWIVLLFAAGLVCIIKGGDLFVDAASWIAEASGIPKFIIGATIVSFATTLPEMLVSVFAALEGNADIAVGNAVGSVTANTGLIMCLSLVCMTCLMERRQFGVKACLLLAAILSLFGFTRDGRLSVAEDQRAQGQDQGQIHDVRADDVAHGQGGFLLAAEWQVAEADPQRVAQEVAIMADRCAIDEELSRLESHISQFADTVHTAQEAGKKLDFLLQEMNREVNTIGSKASDSEIARRVVAAKCVIEKLREQVQNVV